MIELLAPGGSCEGMKAAIHAGADAVYMGGSRFGARAYAQNPEETELLNAMDYCHLHGRKLYLTVNTLLKEKELERELYGYILPLYRRGLDAVLVQDFGVFSFLRRNFPNLPLHASTQMTVSSVDGARLLKEMGAERVVLSRELSLREIEKINREVEIETECFVHGALCYCYSGQCLMSSMIGGRSGNRGRCAQPCRLPYDLYRGTVRQNAERERYLLSLKDICTLQGLPDLIDAGVCSCKIEGRMKRSEYAAGVTEIYRKYIDLYLECGRENYEIDPEDERILMDLYNRGGFSNGYYKVHNGREMMAMERPNHQGTPAARVVGIKGDQIRMEALEPLRERDALELDAGPGNTGREWIIKENVPAGQKFSVAGNPRWVKKNQILARVRSEFLLQNLQNRYLKQEIQEKIKGNFILKREKSAILRVVWKDLTVTAEGERASSALNRPLDEETVRRQLCRTGNTPFVFGELEIELDDGVFYPMQSLNELRRRALEQLEARIVRSYHRTADKPTPLPGGTSSVKAQLVGGAASAKDQLVGGVVSTKVQLPEYGESFASPRPELRASVETFEQLQALLEEPSIEGIYLDCAMFLTPRIAENDGPGAMSFEQVMDRLHERRKKGYLTLPAVWRERCERIFRNVFTEELLEKADGYLLRSGDQIACLRRFGQQKEWIADSSIYTYNREARLFLADRGICRDTMPLECNRRELQERGCEGSECIVYGYIPLMITAQCLVKNTAGCRKQPGIYRLRDRKNIEFPVRSQCCFCMNTIYNSLPLELISCADEIRKLHPASCRLSFTFEDGETVRRLVRMAENALLKGKKTEGETLLGTRGHFRRGVE